MMITTLRENSSETRVAITPTSAKNFIKSGFTVGIEHDAGLAAGFSDADYKKVGVHIIKDKKNLLEQSNILLCINEPCPKDLEGLAPGSLVIGHIDNECGSEGNL